LLVEPKTGIDRKAQVLQVKMDRKILLWRARVLSGRKGMERVYPDCPDCGKRMTYFSGDIFSEHYMCAECNRFLGIPRREGFFMKSPFKPRYTLIHD
jgi:tRNA(Ile2) C34 agmatinyltransferase TiaS